MTHGMFPILLIIEPSLKSTRPMFLNLGPISVDLCRSANADPVGRLGVVVRDVDLWIAFDVFGLAGFGVEVVGEDQAFVGRGMHCSGGERAVRGAGGQHRGADLVLQ